MKAVIVTGAGGTEQLELAEIPDPILENKEEVRVRIQAAGINPVDWKARNAGGFFPDAVPFVLGCDGAGVIESVGEAVTRFKVGDEVYFMNGGCGGDDQGNYAELTVLHQDYVTRKPQSLSMQEAATVPLAWLTAWEALVDRSNLKKAGRVLIQGGAGGVGYLAIQIAKHIGAEVFTTISSPEKAAFAKSLGADHCINYKECDVVEEVLKLTDGVGVDVVFDTVGGPVFANSFAAARVYGHVTTLDEVPCTQEQAKLAKFRNLSLSYELMLTPMFLKMHETRQRQTEMLEYAAALIDDGKIKIHNTLVFELEAVKEAHDLIQEGHVQGKICLRIG